MTCPCHPLFDKHNKTSPDVIAYTTSEHTSALHICSYICNSCVIGSHKPDLVLEMEQNGKLHGFAHSCKEHQEKVTSYYNTRGLDITSVLEIE